jgi:hypothetical protein
MRRDPRTGKPGRGSSRSRRRPICVFTIEGGHKGLYSVESTVFDVLVVPTPLKLSFQWLYTKHSKT